MSYSDRVFRLVAFVMLVTAAAAPQIAGSEDATRISLERNGCPMDLGCPVYKLTLNGDGLVVFEGKSHVRAMGVHKRKIEPKIVLDLAQRFGDIHYFDLPSHVGGACTDAPLVVTSLMIGSKTNQVSNWECGSTASLTELEDEVDRGVNSKRWIRGRLRTWLHWPWFHSQN